MRKKKKKKKNVDYIGGGSSADAEGADGKNVVAATLAGQEKLYF